MIALISHVLFKIIHCFNIILIDPMEKSLIRLPWVEDLKHPGSRVDTINQTREVL